MKHRIHYLVALAFLCLSTLSLYAHDFEAKNADGVTIYYNKLSDTECEVTFYDTTYGLDDYSGPITIPASVSYEGKELAVTSIGDYAFFNCYDITSISIPESVTSIGYSAIMYCHSLTSLNLPEGVTSIGDYTFQECSGLTSITLPNSLTSIGDGAFIFCESLSSINLPEGVISIGVNAFIYCFSLSDIDVDPANSNYSSLDGILFNKDQSTLIFCPMGKQLSEYTIPNTVTSILDNAFAYSSSLTSITFSDSLISIGNDTFIGCTSFTSITLPNNLTTIGNGAFEYCTSVTSISIPNSLTSIGHIAFEGCTSLTSVTNLADSPQQINSSIFNKVPLANATLYVPAGSIEAYKNAPVWQDFGRILDVETKSDDTSIGTLNQESKPTVRFDLMGRRINQDAPRTIQIEQGKKSFVK